MCMEALCIATGVDSPCDSFARRIGLGLRLGEETCQHDVRRAFSQHGEIRLASGCRGIDMLYGGYRVGYEVKYAS